MAHGFFRRGRDGDLERRVFDLAYFWRVSPLVIESLTMSEFDRWETQALRIYEDNRTDDDG